MDIAHYHTRCLARGRKHEAVRPSATPPPTPSTEFSCDRALVIHYVWNKQYIKILQFMSVLSFVHCSPSIHLSISLLSINPRFCLFVHLWCLVLIGLLILFSSGESFWDYFMFNCDAVYSNTNVCMLNLCLEAAGWFQGITVKQEGDDLVIARILKGSAIERQGDLGNCLLTLLLLLPSSSVTPASPCGALSGSG